MSRYTAVASSKGGRNLATPDSVEMIRYPLLARLDARDRAFFLRWVIGDSTPRRTTRAWTLLTHIGGVRVSVLAVLLPMLFATGLLRTAALQGAWALTLSHIIVQIVKRKALRARPSVRSDSRTHVEIPDRFSFPSGHSCAAMSVAFVYAMVFPVFAPPILLLATLVGFSRVRLGVHYPGDVIVGQLTAIVTAIGVIAVW